MYNISQATIGSSLSGRAFGAKNVCGTITNIYPGLGFEVKKDGYKYLAIDNFSSKEYEMRHFIEMPAPENLYHSVSKETINFWISAGYKTKERIYGKEIQMRKLIEKDSMYDLPLPFSLAPFIEPHPPLPMSPLPRVPKVERLPLDFNECILDEEPNRFQIFVRRLTRDEIMEGIEAAQCEVNRIKRNTILWHNNQDLKYHLEWLDAAWQEIDERNN